MRHTRGSASSAACRVASSPRPAAIASAKSAGSFFGARPRLADRDDRRATARGAVGREAALDRLRVLAREVPLAGVVAAALRAEDQEAAQPRPVVDRPGEAARAVANLVRAGIGADWGARRGLSRCR